MTSSSASNPTAAQPTSVLTGLRRRLTLFDVFCLGVNAIVGSGVFGMPDDMQRAMGGFSPFAFLLCALLLMPVALCFAELGSRYEETGGAYLYAAKAFGPRVGFVVGWFCWIATLPSWAANMSVLVELLGFKAYPLAKIIAVGGVLALGAINYFGVKPGAWVVNLVVIGKLAAIFCFVAVGVMALDPSKLGGALPKGALGVGQGIYLALFPIQGFEVAPVAAGETIRPTRNVPLGTLGALLFSALLYVLVQAVLASSYPDLAKETGTPLVDGARYLNPTLGTVVLIGSMISVGGFTAGSALGSPRYALAIAARGLFPRSLASLHEKWGTPHIAIIVTTLITAVLAGSFDYRKLVGMANITVVVQYIFTCIAVLMLRKSDPTPNKGFVIPGGPVVPLIGAVGSVAFLAGSDLGEAIFAAGALLVGLVVLARFKPSKKVEA